MARSCQTCNHPKRKEIDLKLAAGEQIKAIGRKYALSPHSLGYHKARHLNYLLGTDADISGLRSMTVTTKTRRSALDVGKC